MYRRFPAQSLRRPLPEWGGGRLARHLWARCGGARGALDRLWETGALATFTSQAPGAVNALGLRKAPSLPELAELGVARVSYGWLLHRQATEEFGRVLPSLASDAAGTHR
jgi:hypothetical protein